jgi:hypothetical protein
MCYKAKHTKHTVVGYTTLVPHEYTNIHNKVAGIIRWTMFKHMELKVTDRYYGHIPERVVNIRVPP